MENLLKETKMLNHNAPEIQALVQKWRGMDEGKRIFEIYNYVRDEIPFGYNESDYLSATDEFKDGCGQCNTKGTLFMTLLRAVGIPCRIHGFYIDKKMQKGAMKSFYYALAPRDIVHTWVEIFYDGKWLNMEGFILDKKYLGELQRKFGDCNGSFCGYGVAISDFKNPPIDWNGGDTYIQKDGITKDLGVFDTPDELFAKHKQKDGAFRHFFFKYFVRHLMNRNVEKIRRGVSQ